ncbi:polysaccharide biosynthesis/export family protein [Aliihoeflea sp. PC F10.4]
MFERNSKDRRSTSAAYARAVGLAAMLGLSLSIAPASAADYLIQPGDILQIDVTGVSGMQHMMPVGPDGMVRAPLAGSVPVAGRNIHDIAALLQARLASRTLRQSSPSGDEFLVIIDPERVLVSVAEYRPVYVNGDVASPGEQRYRPGLTVRQSISLAGGYEIGDRPQSSDMSLQVADFQAEHASLWTQYTRETMRIARIRSELAGADAAPSFDVDNIPLPQSTVAELARLETEMFDVHRVDRAKERAFLEGEIENSMTQLTTVREQQEQEREGLEADTTELERHREMEQRGITTSARVSESRRNLLMSSTRYLQATVQIAQFGREEASLRRRLDQQEDESRSELLGELQEAVVSATSIAEQIAAVSDKLLYARAGRTRLSQEPDQAPTVTVIRNDDAAPQTIDADQDMPLMPGDVVEVSLPDEPRGPAPFLQN